MLRWSLRNHKDAYKRFLGLQRHPTGMIIDALCPPPSSLSQERAASASVGTIFAKEKLLSSPNYLISFVEYSKNEYQVSMTEKTTASEYLLLFRGNNWTEDLAPEENKIAKFTSWFEGEKNSGIFKSGHLFEQRDKILAGRNALTDDQFAPSKEAIAAFFIQADSVEQAVEITKRCPALDYGQSVEVEAIVSEPA